MPFKQQSKTRLVPVPDAQHQLGVPFERGQLGSIILNPRIPRRLRGWGGHSVLVHSFGLQTRTGNPLSG